MNESDFYVKRPIYVDFIIRNGEEADITPEDLDNPRVMFFTDTKEFIVSRGDGTYENITREIERSLRETNNARLDYNLMEQRLKGSDVTDKQLYQMFMALDVDFPYDPESGSGEPIEDSLNLVTLRSFTESVKTILDVIANVVPKSVGSEPVSGPVGELSGSGAWGSAFHSETGVEYEDMPDGVSDSFMGLVWQLGDGGTAQLLVDSNGHMWIRTADESGEFSEWHSVYPSDSAAKLSEPHSIGIVSGGLPEVKAEFDGTGDVTINLVGVDATTLDGVIPLANLPQGALERVVDVADESVMLALTPEDVQLGDIVRLLDSGRMFVVVDEEGLSSEAGYVEFTAGIATKAVSAETSEVSDKSKSSEGLVGHEIGDADIDTYVGSEWWGKTAFAESGNSCAGKPEGIDSFALFALQASGDSTVQMLISGDSDGVYVRRENPEGGWGEWNKLYPFPESSAGLEGIDLQDDDFIETIYAPASEVV